VSRTHGTRVIAGATHTPAGCDNHFKRSEMPKPERDKAPQLRLHCFTASFIGLNSVPTVQGRRRLWKAAAAAGRLRSEQPPRPPARRRHGVILPPRCRRERNREPGRTGTLVERWRLLVATPFPKAGTGASRVTGASLH
jgi:hypothetical protein